MAWDRGIITDRASTVWRLLALVPAVALSDAASAQSDPRFCPSQPSLGSSACTTLPGEIHLEVSAIDWQHDRTARSQDDDLLLGDFQARIGLGPTTEAQVGWTSYGRDRSRSLGEPAERDRGIGDLTLGIRQNLRNPDGKGFSFGIEGSVSVPTGHGAIGAGDWGATLDMPFSLRVTRLVSLSLTVETDAAVDEDRAGRHFAGDAIATVGLHPAKDLTLYTETEVVRDLDPAGATTQVFAAQGVSLKVAPRGSVWAEAVAGLNPSSPDVRVFSGFTILF